MVIQTLAFHAAKVRADPPPALLLEHPQNPAVCSTSALGEQCSSICAVPNILYWSKQLGLSWVSFDQCHLGQSAVKPTTLATNMPLHHWRDLRCDHGPHQRSKDRKSSDLSRYPPQMMMGVAMAFREMDVIQGKRPILGKALDVRDRPKPNTMLGFAHAHSEMGEGNHPWEGALHIRAGEAT